MVCSRDDVSWYTYSFEDEVESPIFCFRTARLGSSGRTSTAGKSEGEEFFAFSSSPSTRDPLSLFSIDPAARRSSL